MDPVFDLEEPPSKKTRCDRSVIKCVLCDGKDKRSNLRVLENQGKSTLKAKAAERLSFCDRKDKDLIDRVSGSNFETDDSELLYHKRCYDRLVNYRTPKQHISSKPASEHRDISSEENKNVCRPVTRGMLAPWVKSLCIFCQKESDEDTVLVMTMSVSNAIMDASKHDYIMRVRTAGISDLVASDAIYHKHCRTKFERRVKKAKEAHETSPRDLCYTRLADEIKDGVMNGHVYTLLDVWHRFEQLMSELGVSTGNYRNNKTRFKQRLEKELVNIIDFVPQLDSQAPQLLFSKKSVKMAIPKLLKKHDELIETLAIQDLGASTNKVTETEGLSLFRTTAMSIRDDIMSIEGVKNNITVNEKEVSKIVPSSLYLFLRLLVSGYEATLDSEEENNSDIDRKILSVAQDLVYIVSNCRKLTPKHIGLGLTLHQATRSKDLVNLVHAAGHCISYDQVRRIDTSIAKTELESFADNGNVSVPHNIEPGKFFQFSADNIDIIEETLDGKGTFHATQVAVFQRGNTRDMPLDFSIGKEKKLDVPESFHSLILPPAVPSKPAPKFETPVDINWYDPDEDLGEKAFINDLSWMVTRLHTPDNQKVPFWTGFNQIVSTTTSEITTVGHLPILNAPAHDWDTLWTIIVRCKNLSAILNHGQPTVLTLDEQLYCKAKMLQWSNFEATRTLVLRLGSFHTAMTFMRAIGKHMSDSGLVEVWSESGVFGENTASNNMSAKSYNRSLRAHKLTFEALLRILWPQFLIWLSEQQLQICPSIEKKIGHLVQLIESRDDIDTIVETFNDIKSSIKASNVPVLMQDFQETRSPTAKYWQQYLDMVSVLLQFIRAEREGNWALHLSSFASMLPWFAIYDHVNYTRWGSVYLADMRQLETCHVGVYQQFMAGNFVVKKTKQNFNQISTDQALEHINKISKSVGGLVGITREDNARDRWCLTYNYRSQISENTYELFGMYDIEKEYAVWETKESNPSRLRRDEQDVRKIMEQLDRFNVFNEGRPDLINLSTMDVAPDDIATALLTAHDRGKKEIQEFVDERLIQHKKDFHDSIKQNRSRTLSAMYEVTLKSDVTEKTKTIKAGRELFQRLLVSKEAGRHINLEEILCHELSNTPLSIADTAGNLLACESKSDLASILEIGATSPSLTASEMKTTTLIDGQALVHIVGRMTKAKTFGNFADDFITAVNRNEGSRIDIVFDRYREDSIKNVTRDRRSRSRRPIRRLIENRNTPFPVNWDQFISSTENKASLAAFLSHELMTADNVYGNREIVTSGGFTETCRAEANTGREINSLMSDHEEADTRLILHAKEASNEGYERLVIYCKDTDVLVLLIFFANELSKEIWMQSGNFKTPKFIKIHQIDISSELREGLLGFHAISGCDTVSHFRGYGKKKAWKVFGKYPKLLKDLGVGSLTDETISNVEEFVCRLYCEGSDITTVNELRCRLFRQGKVEPEKLPPAKDTLVQHIRRAHYQAAIWRASLLSKQEPNSPTQNGWSRDLNGIHLKPVLTTIEPVPDNCLAIISCTCKSCSTARCKCRRSMMICTPACTCSGNVCSNPFNTA